ncbi:MAG: hypothetical protein AB1640_14720 [bacterium]
MLPIRSLALLVGLCVTACGDSSGSGPLSYSAECTTSPAEAFENLFDDTFLPLCPDASGSGAFGAWETDPSGAPVYRYAIDHRSDPRAATFTSWGDSRDHWHQLGNDAVTVTAHNEGYLQLWHWGRGGKCLNRWQPERGNFAGGFRFIEAGGEIWNTLYAPEAFSRFERLFGMGYFEKETVRQDLSVRERSYVPFGDGPLLVSETEIVNQGAAPRELLIFEYWDYNLYELLPAPIMTAPLGALFEALRWVFNGSFTVGSSLDELGGFLAVTPSLAAGGEAPLPEAISIADYYPGPCFLAGLTATPDFFFTDQQAFFGSGGLGRPEALASGTTNSTLLPQGTPEVGRACLAMGKKLRLDPGERVFLAYAFGSGPPEEAAPLIEDLRRDPESNFKRTMDAWLETRVDFVTPEPEWLRREAMWHGYYLPSGAFREDYFSGSIVNQGSAYAYIQGLNGAHRDFALFAMPLVYLRPDLARETLRYTMRSQDAATGEIPYAHQGYGFTTGALVHEESTDLDLFFLMAAAEYLGATRDFGFLDEPVPFYPLSAERSGPVREHLQAALDHLELSIGTGPHGLIRAGSGDWNDVLIAFSPHPLLTMIRGESNLNTGMACYVFPRLAELLRDRLPELAGRLDARAEDFRRRLAGEWAGRWMRRGYLGDGSWLGEDQLFLDAQAWPLLAGIWDESQASTLLANIEEMLVTPSPAGALCLYPPNPAPYLVQGSDTNGGTWAALDSWLAWAWSAHDPEAAWRFFLGTTLNRHAEAYPDIWYGVWSGPDSYNAFYAERPGETFNWSFTPMTDFPVMNMNRHSGPLLDVIRLAGIEPAGDRIRVAPALPFAEFSLRLPLIGVAYLPDRARGYYNPVAGGTFRFSVRLPRQLSAGGYDLFVDGKRAEAVQGEGELLFEAEGEPGKRITWEILPAGG